MAVSVMAGMPALKDSYQQLKSRMDKAVQDFQANLASTRTGRASIQMLDHVKVDYYGTPTPLNQVGQLTTPDANLIVIQPWDPGIIVEIEKASTHLRSRLQSSERRQDRPHPCTAHD